MDKLRLFFIVVCSLACAYALHRASTQLRRSHSIDLLATTPVEATSPASRALRPNYPYSVIPGGAYSPAELKSAMERDPLIRDHYSDFNWRAARLVNLTEDRLQYVSYRLKNKLFWTRSKLRISKGETLLTDGIHFARTRCGNRLSSQPNPGTSTEQPPTELLSLSALAPATLQLSKVQPAAPPATQNQLEAAPLLTFDLTRSLSSFPIDSLGSVPSSEQVWPSMATYPPTAGIIAWEPPLESGYLPSVPSPAFPFFPRPNTPASIWPPVIPQTPLTPTTPVSEVPEPASATLLLISFGGLIWLFIRAMRTANQPSQPVPSDSRSAKANENLSLR